MKPSQRAFPQFLFLTSLVLAGLAFRATATPYASGVNYNPGTTVLSFILNEGALDVSVVTNAPDNSSGTYDLGALAKGAYSVTLGSAISYSIIVSNISGPGWRSQIGVITNTTSGLLERANAVLQISDNLNPNVVLNSGRGLAINRNPASPNFGRVYVANSAASAVPFTNSNALIGSGGYRLNGVGDGIYVLNADLSDTFGSGTPRTAGLDAAFTNNGDTPYRLFLGSDERLYVCGKANTNSANVWMTDADVSPGSGTNIFTQMAGEANATTTFPVGTLNNHGGIESVWVSGSLANGNANFYVMDNDNQANQTTTTSSQRQSIWSNKNHSYADLPISTASGQPFAAPGSGWQTEIAQSSNVGDFDRGSPLDQYYMVVYKTAGDATKVYNNTFGGTGLYTSDLKQAGYCVSLSPDGGMSYLAVGRRDDGQIWIYPLDSAAYLPRDSRRAMLGTGLNNSGGTYRVRQVKFDAAFNLYVTQDNMPLRVFSPGGASVATTSGDINGTTSSSFSLLFGPAITSQTSTNVSIAVGATNSTAFSCLGDYVTNVPAFSKQWYKVGVGALPNNDTGLVGNTPVGHISNGQSATMTFTPLSCADGGDYFLVTANAIGATTSSIVHLTVTGDPAIMPAGQPINATNYIGTTAQFTVIPTGTAPFAYQWKHAGTNLLDGPTGLGSTIAGSTTATLSVINCSPADGTNGTYSVVVTNTSPCSSGTVTSAARSLVVWGPPVINSVVALGGGNYQLTFSGAPGQPFTLRYSSDVTLPLNTPWTPLMISTFGNTPVTFFDSSVDPQRFYILTSP